MRKYLIVLLPAIGLLGCGSPPATAPVRLLAAEGIEASGPAPRIESAGSGAPRFAAVPPARVGRVAMAGAEGGWDARASLLGGDGTRYRFLVELPEDPALRLGLGYVLPEQEPASPSRLRFLVDLVASDGAEEPTGSPTPIVDETLQVHRDAGWRNLEIPIPRRSGDRVLLELRTEVEEGSVAAWATPEVVSRAREEDGWDVLLVSLDTLRADHLGAYGYSRPTSPHLDALAAGGIRFAAPVAQAPWTRPSHRSLLDGLYPASRGDLTSPMLPSLLWQAGYRTTAITGGGQIDPRFGFDEGIESYRIYQWVDAAEHVHEALLESRGRKQFLFLHTYRIHDPYRGDDFTGGLPSGRIGEAFGKHDWRAFDKELSDEEKAYVEALYDGGIAVTDRSLGDLFGSMERSGLLDRTIVVVTSDHGEQFWEHGTWRHGQVLYDHQIVVPLIVRLPPPLARQLGVEPGTVIEEQVELVDLYPTLLDLLGVPLEHSVQGRSVVPLLTGDGLPADDALSENTNIKDYERKALRSTRFKFIKSIPRRSARARGITEPRYALFDLRRDPEEYHNIADRHPELVELLDRRLRSLHDGLTGLEDEVPEQIDADLRERLRALGYLGDQHE